MGMMEARPWEGFTRKRTQRLNAKCDDSVPTLPAIRSGLAMRKAHQRTAATSIVTCYVTPPIVSLLVTLSPRLEKRAKTRRSNPSPTNLRPQNRRAERLAFRFCSFYLAADDYEKRSIFVTNRLFWTHG